MNIAMTVTVKLIILGAVIILLGGCASFGNCRYEKETGPTMVCSTPDTKGM